MMGGAAGMKQKHSKTIGAVAGALSVIALQVLKRTGCLAGWNELSRIALTAFLGWGFVMLLRRFSGPAEIPSSSEPILPE